MNRKRTPIACKPASFKVPVIPQLLASHSLILTHPLHLGFPHLTPNVWLRDVHWSSLNYESVASTSDHTAAESDPSRSPEKRMWQMTYEFHYTYATEQNAFMQNTY